MDIYHHGFADEALFLNDPANFGEVPAGGALDRHCPLAMAVALMPSTLRPPSAQSAWHLDWSSSPMSGLTPPTGGWDMIPVPPGTDTGPYPIPDVDPPVEPLCPDHIRALVSLHEEVTTRLAQQRQQQQQQQQQQQRRPQNGDHGPRAGGDFDPGSGPGQDDPPAAPFHSGDALLDADSPTGDGGPSSLAPGFITAKQQLAIDRQNQQQRSDATHFAFNSNRHYGPGRAPGASPPPDAGPSQRPLGVRRPPGIGPGVGAAPARKSLGGRRFLSSPGGAAPLGNSRAQDEEDEMRNELGCYNLNQTPAARRIPG
ncbi:hypothetical protein H696_03512 [Fonticula alba]|uniref:Uncharacterized protein n=1 Tax=Fonticula alba TaxID=691883 RepID=A0A058Z6Z4_FONAL|nr:hypothetical protein H696_03512 [Fonticula alba]KCV70049.1 hypothetical protein H696_03512 [Fonticula alba]|eukprot:XP_009495655.1 hypothetical protein H696_03512 [Fonticula alba]